MLSTHAHSHEHFQELLDSPASTPTHTSFLVGSYLLRTNWVHGPAPGPGQTTPHSWPPKCCSRPRGLVISKDWTTGPASRLVMPCVSQQAGSRRGPSWQAASSHTWLNRDNGGGSSGPASFPLAEPQAHECPEAPAANSPPGRQPEGAQGTSREGSSEGPRKVPHPTSPHHDALSGKGATLHPLLTAL